MSALSHVVVSSLEKLSKLSVENVAGPLSTIFNSAKEIGEIAKRIKGSNHQCVRLNRRIQMFVGLLKSKQVNDTNDQSMISALINFAIFLQKCIKFMNLFVHAGFIKRLWHNRSYSAKFTNLHIELTEFGCDFNMSIALRKVLNDKNQDQYDQLLDSIHIQQEIDVQTIKNNKCHSFSVISELVNIPIHREYEDQTEDIVTSDVWMY